jgi:hypothetical protein
MSSNFLAGCQWAQTKKSTKYFDVMMEPETTVDQLDDWLSSALVMTSTDALTWWTAMEAAGDPMARMALNFISIPGAFPLCIYL